MRCLTLRLLGDNCYVPMTMDSCQSSDGRQREESVVPTDIERLSILDWLREGFACVGDVCTVEL